MDLLTALGLRIASVLSLSLIATGQLESPPSDKRVPVTSPDVTQLGLDDLIERLPRAGLERSYDIDRGTTYVDPAALELHRRLSSGTTMSDQQWRRAILGTGALRWRAKWPAELRFAVSMCVPGWLGPAQITAVPRTPGLSGARAEFDSSNCTNYARSCARRQGYQELGVLLPGVSDVVFDVTVERAVAARVDDPALGSFPPPGILWTGTVQARVEVVRDPDEAFPRIHGPEIDSAVRRSLCLERPWTSGANASKETTTLRFDADSSDARSLESAAISLQVDLMRDGKFLESYATSIQPRWVRSGTEPDHAVLVQELKLSWTPGQSPAGGATLDGLEIRVRGVRADVERLWDAATRWDGELRCRLADLPMCPEDER